MSFRRMHVLAVLTVGVVGLSATAAMAAPASSHRRVGPNQVFVGLVNGGSGATQPAVIRVVCPSPMKPGETTHPLPHQTLEVRPASTVDKNVGHTGPSATQISAFMGIPPSSANGEGIATFKRYGVPKPIPTTLNVPCSGSGYITFIPFPRDPGMSRAYVVPVEYANIAV